MEKRTISHRTAKYNEIQKELKAFYSLPLERAVVYLREIHKKSFYDIADILDFSGTEVSNIYKDAKRRGVSA